MTMKLYAWQPRGHGQQSFFVCAESEGAARSAVDQEIARLKSTAELDEYSVRGWGTAYYDLTIADPGYVVQNEND